MYKKILVIIELFILLITLSGCFNYAEIQSFAIVTGFAIDKGEEQRFKVTAETLSIESGKDGKVKPILLDQEGDTILEAVRKMIAIFGKKIYGAHAKVLIISEEIAKECVCETLDFFMRDPEIRPIMSVFVAKEIEAYKILKDTELFMDISSYEIERLALNDSESLSYGRRVQLYQATNTMLSRGTELTLPVLELEKIGDKESFRLYGLALFKDEKLISMLEGDKVKYFLSFLDEFIGSSISIKLDNGAYVNYELREGGTKTKLKINKDRFEFTINFKVSFYLESISDNDEGKEMNLNDFEPRKVFKEYWEKNMLEVYEYIKELKSDVFGFGRQIMGHDFKKWSSIKDENVFDKIDIKINIEATNYGTGKGD